MYASDDEEGSAGRASPDPFERIDWDEVDDDHRVLDRSVGTFLLLSVGLFAAFCYHFLVVPKAYTLVGPFDPSALDWLVLLALVFAVSFVLVPLASDPTWARRYWAALRARQFGRASLAFVLLASAAALAGPEVLGPASSAKLPFTQGAVRQPTSGLAPPGFGVPLDTVLYCSGEKRGGMCYGMLAHPLGTTASGKDVLAFVVGGFRVAFEVAILTSILLVPMALLAGTAAAFLGGWVDAVVTRASDFLQVVPALVVYLFVRLMVGAELWLLVVLFGLLGWGRIARQVRAEALSLREEGYVRAALSAGSSPFETVRRHVVPNVSHVAVGALALQIPKLVVVEVTLSYLGLVSTETPSWGYAIVSGLKDPTLPIETIGVVSPLRLWWTWVFPLVALLLTVVTTTVLVRALGDTLDPQEVHR